MGYYNIRGEAVFALRGRAMGANSPVDFRVSVAEGAPNYWTANSAYSQKGALIRVVEFRLSTPNLTPPDLLKPRPLRVTGRISAGNRWPLAFEFEPIDRLQTKPGQKLQFKQWPAPLPPNFVGAPKSR